MCLASLVPIVGSYSSTAVGSYRILRVDTAVMFWQFLFLTAELETYPTQTGRAAAGSRSTRESRHAVSRSRGPPSGMVPTGPVSDR
eukprot:COSAG05_NODE_602_length_8420_cov_13.540199_9_plen_86_part_00